MVETTDEWIMQRVGIKERRILKGEGKGTSDLGEPAVRGLLEKGGCNVCHMQECLGMPQSTTSQHLQKLRSAGIISGQRKGLEITYQVCDKRVIELIEVLFPEQKKQ